MAGANSIAAGGRRLTAPYPGNDKDAAVSAFKVHQRPKPNGETWILKRVQGDAIGRSPACGAALGPAPLPERRYLLAQPLVFKRSNFCSQRRSHLTHKADLP